MITGLFFFSTTTVHVLRHFVVPNGMFGLGLSSFIMSVLPVGLVQILDHDLANHSHLLTYVNQEWLQSNSDKFCGQVKKYQFLKTIFGDLAPKTALIIFQRIINIIVFGLIPYLLVPHRYLFVFEIVRFLLLTIYYVKDHFDHKPVSSSTANASEQFTRVVTKHNSMWFLHRKSMKDGNSSVRKLSQRRQGLSASAGE
jgi:hypothetical protein